MKIIHNFKRHGKTIKGQILYTHFESEERRGDVKDGFLRSIGQPEIMPSILFAWGARSSDHFNVIDYCFNSVEEASDYMEKVDKYTLKPKELKGDWLVSFDNQEQKKAYMFSFHPTKLIPMEKYITAPHSPYGYGDNPHSPWKVISFNELFGIGENKKEEKTLTKTTKLTKAQLEELLGESKGRLSSISSELESVKKETTKLKKEYREQLNAIEEKQKENEALKKELEKLNSLMTIKKTKKKKNSKGKAWDGIIIEDNIYDKLKFAFKTKMPLLLRGPSGTGKSSMTRALGADEGVDVIDFNFNGDTTVEHLLGHKILVGGNMEWEDGPLTDAVRNGKIFVGHEINASSPGIQFILNGLLEHVNGQLGKLSVQGNNGEVLVPHPNFRFFGTYNPGYLGTKMFGTSIMSRFIGIDIPPLSKEDEKQLLISKFPGQEIAINLLVDMENTLRKNSNFTYDVSTRDLIQCLTFISGGFSIEDAVNTCIYNSVQIDLEKKILKDEIEKINKAI